MGSIDLIDTFYKLRTIRRNQNKKKQIKQRIRGYPLRPRAVSRERCEWDAQYERDGTRGGTGAGRAQTC